MLCSRDIQVGDEIYNNGGKLEFPVQSEREKEVFTRNGSFFKVIGEISPNAIWVKEGDEFEESEIGYWFSGMSNATPLSELSNNDKSQESKKLAIERFQNKFKPVYLKCPTCNHFH